VGRLVEDCPPEVGIGFSYALQAFGSTSGAPFIRLVSTTLLHAVLRALVPL